MGIVKLVLKKLCFGFLYGTGFTVGVFLSALLIEAYVYVPIFSDTEHGSQKIKGITIDSSKAIVKSPYIDFIGTLRNVGKETVEDTTVVVNLFDR